MVSHHDEASREKVVPPDSSTLSGTSLKMARVVDLQRDRELVPRGEDAVEILHGYL